MTTAVSKPWDELTPMHIEVVARKTAALRDTSPYPSDDSVSSVLSTPCNTAEHTREFRRGGRIIVERAVIAINSSWLELLESASY